MIALDTETTGVDFRHGARPFFVTACDEDDNVRYWEWDVDPLTRKPDIPPQHLQEIVGLIWGEYDEWFDSEERTDLPELVFQNPRFDVRALATVIPFTRWPWYRTYDTLMAGHLLCSKPPHNLTHLAKTYLGYNIKPFEDTLEKHVKACRNLVRQARLARKRGNPKKTIQDRMAEWRIAEEDLPEMPSANTGSTKAEKGVEDESPWKFDSWLPRAVAKFFWEETGEKEWEPPYTGVKVISGGQTGVDRAALEAARLCGLQTGGMAPKGWRTTQGSDRSLEKRYGLKEHTSAAYPPRTLQNIIDADATVQLYETMNSPGEILTAQLVKHHRKPHLALKLGTPNLVERIVDFCVEYDTVNFAGNSEETCPGIYQRALNILRQVFPFLKPNPGHPYWSSLRDYSNADSSVTVQIMVEQKHEIKRRKLEKVYAYMLTQLPVFYSMEERGVCMSKLKTDELTDEYTEESETRGAVCTNIAAGFDYELKLPKGSNNDNLKTFCFDENYLNLPHVKVSKKTGVPSLDKETMGHYSATLPDHSVQGRFVRNLLLKRKLDTSLNYMEGYRRFWLPVPGHPDFYVLYPQINPTGTSTLRCSHSNPNEANISKKKDSKGRTLRDCIVPRPGYELWSMDAENIELRIPAYRAPEPAMIELFEQPNKPPYYGSYHLLVAHVLHPKLFEECRGPDGEIDGRIFKERYDSTWYQWVKNGNFAVQYGAQESSGTADRAYHVPGAQAIIMGRFTNIKKLNDRAIAFATRHGYVETMPDKTVDPERGYPMVVTMTEWNKVLPTVPLSYETQGTAMQWTRKAMVRCEAKLKEWREEQKFDAGMIMQIHDEIVFEFPKSKVHPQVDRDKEKERKGKPFVYQSNLGKARTLQRLMRQGGDDIGIPTPVSIKYHEESWGKGMSL